MLIGQEPNHNLLRRRYIQSGHHFKQIQTSNLLSLWRPQVLGLFSKVVGVQPQGTLMGWFGSAGALARGVFPIVAGEGFHTFSISFGRR